MTNSDNQAPQLTIGYELDAWRQYREKVPITIDLSPKTNSHILLCGMSGSGKSYLENQIMSKVALAEPDGEVFFGDYKQDDAFAYLRGCPRYYGYKNTLQALDIVHGRLLARQSEDNTSRRNPVTLVWDEYMAQLLALINEDKKAAAVIMGKVSEILMLGRSLSIRLVISCQRPDALAFPAGSRTNVGVFAVLGTAPSSTYEMTGISDFMDEFKGRRFGRGEGVALFQGSELHFIKVGAVKDTRRMQEICIKALGGKE